MNDLDKLIQSDSTAPAVEADNSAIEKAIELSRGYRAEDHDGNRLRIHLVLRSQSLADRLKRCPLNEEMAANVELYAYTKEDLWAMNLLGISPESSTRLDRKPITADSRQCVHLVVLGCGSQAESLAVHAALTSHFPNYCQDSSLRTRITMVVDSHKQLLPFQQRYRNLLLNSYRRTVTLNGDNVDCVVMAPQYANHRRDFVDVEWEFVEGTINDVPLTYKLQQWSNDEMQQLTIALCHPDDDRNITEAFVLQSEINPNIPIWMRVKESTAIDFIRQSGQNSSLIPFGMSNSELPDMSDFIRMGQCVNFAYTQMKDISKEDQERGMSDLSVAIEMPSEELLQELWNNPKLNTPKRWSNLFNAFTLRHKMSSLNHPVSEWGTLFAVSNKEVEQLSEVEHNRWSVEELILGFRPTTDEEHAAILQDSSLKGKYRQEMIHDDLRNYYELGVDDSGLNVNRYDIGLTRTLPLVAYTYYHLKKQHHE